MNYLKRAWNVILFIILWVGLPNYLATVNNDDGWYAMLLVMWVPALIIILYLEDEE